MGSFKVYIVNRSSQLPVIVLAEPATKSDLTLVSRKNRGWHFNWLEIGSQVGMIVYKITYQKQIQGLVAFSRPPREDGVVPVTNFEAAPSNFGHSGGFGVGPTLAAIVCGSSVAWGFDGFIAFQAKTKLVEHYRKHFRARVVYGDNMVVDDNAAKTLIERYIVGGDADVE